MECTYMLNQMCHEVLSNADINAIRKARGFTKHETESRSQLESFFISSIGLETAMAQLTPQEVAVLHLLHQKPEAVDLTFFERVYGSARRDQKHYYGTFTQQYKDTLKAVRLNLLRRGLLAMAELRTRADNTKMERWRFRFPPEFAPYLPPLIAEPQPFDTPGDDRSIQAQRAKVLEALDGSAAKKSQQQRFQVVVRRGDFTLGKQPISVRGLNEWQQLAWAASLSVTLPGDDGQSLRPVAALNLILETLKPGEWAALDQICTAYDIFCFGVRAPDLKSICKIGWETGSLVRQVINRKPYYRLAASQPAAPATLDLSAYLQPQPEKGAVIVDLETIPFEILEALNILTHLAVENQQLVATPSKIKLGRAKPEIREAPLGNWLSTQIPAFGEIFELIAANWGQTILHTNVLIAQVKDLSLRVQLEKRLGDDLVILADDFIAFPMASRREVEKVVQKAGFVVKTVNA